VRRLAVVVSHPIQYYAPLFRELAGRVSLEVYFAQQVTAAQQGAAGFGGAFDWDVDLFSGYDSEFLDNVSRRPGPSRFEGADTPGIGQRLAEGRFDAVLVFGWYLKSFVQTIRAARRLGLPVMVRGDSQLGPPGAKSVAKAIAYPTLLRVFDAALYVGASSRAFYEHYRYPTARLFHSPHCVDTDWFAARATAESGQALRSQLGIGRTEKAVLFAGKLVPFKRPLDVVDAWPLTASRPHILIAGSGDLDEALAARAQAIGAPIHRLGFLNQTEMPNAYAAADLLVLPSTTRETWGLVANEALACGVPIVVSDAAGGSPDLAGDGLAGRVFPMGDLAALAQAIDGVLVKPPPPEALAARSQSHSLAAAANGVEIALAAVAARRVRGRNR
jgi:glycosyltransferase involved in cell wall biosynthesis